ncbi:MAG: metallophosphoesterase, partial [Acidobacteria bacterium]|nr:metallophosphoesterase [Acidobacteriota bacterium]
MSAQLSWQWPLDILHVSDLHFFGDPVLDSARNAAWRALCNDVAQRRRKGVVRPHIIACTGDLVETPSEKAFRRGVNALLELAEECGFLEESCAWQEGEERPPEAWWQLLNHRIFLIPGNHDVFASGLRILFLGKASGEWARITDPEGRVPPGRLEPTPAALAGPLAVRMIDSNGSRAFWKTARGSVDRQVDLAWPQDLGVGDHHFRMALVHAHPLQVPFFVQGVFDDEASLMMDNAGFLLKNLADLGVRLILHGHRHYPCCYTLSLQDSRDAIRSVAIVGAGSATKAPARWKYVSYNWVRIYPDQRVEVRILRRDPEAPAFSGFASPVAATLGDFSCERLERVVKVWNSFGDLEVTTRFSGLRALPGRPPVRCIPFERRVGSQVEYSARTLRGSAGSRQVAWDAAAGSLELDPPLDAAGGAIDLEVRHHLHGGAALTSWQALQMYGAGPGAGDREHQRYALEFEARDVSFEVHLGSRFSPPEPETCRARYHRPGQSTESQEADWNAATHVLALDRENPKPPVVLELEWPLPEAAAPEPGTSNSNQWASVRLALLAWQRSLLDG